MKVIKFLHGSYNYLIRSAKVAMPIKRIGTFFLQKKTENSKKCFDIKNSPFV